MKTRLAALISFTGAIGWSVFIIFVIKEETTNNDTGVRPESLLAILAVLISTISGILYITWTNFGRVKSPEIEKIDHEIQLLRKQIEKKELMNKLEGAL